MRAFFWSSMFVIPLVSTACGDGSPASGATIVGDSAAIPATEAGANGSRDAAATTDDGRAPRVGDDGGTPHAGDDGRTPRVGDGGGATRPSDGGRMTRPGDDGAMPSGGEGGLDAGPKGSPGCATGQALEQGENTFMLEGRERRYVLHLPNGYGPDRAWPVIFALHGNGGSIDYWNQQTGDRNIRAVVENDAILVIAEAIEGNWRDYDMSAETWPARVEAELAYFDTIAERLKEGLCVDERGIFSMGFSGGGSFSGVLGCRREYIRAIAVGGSVIYFDESDCVGTPAAWITIGAEELNSGREAFRDYFRSAAMCQPTSTPTDPSPCVAYDGCAAASPVHYCQHAGGHVWPALGTQAAWRFFQRFID